MIKFYTVSEVAEMLQSHEETIRRKLRSGEIKGINFGKSWRISQENLEKYLKGE